MSSVSSNRFSFLKGYCSTISWCIGRHFHSNLKLKCHLDNVQNIQDVVLSISRAKSLASLEIMSFLPENGLVPTKLYYNRQLLQVEAKVQLQCLHLHVTADAERRIEPMEHNGMYLSLLYILMMEEETF